MVIQKNLGFTLLELIIIILILGIIAVVASIKFPGTSVTVDTQAAQLASDVRYTQNLSMARNQHYRLVTSTSSYTIQDGSSNPIYTTTLGTGITLTTTLPNNIIVFNSKGVPYSDDSTPLAIVATISLTDSKQTTTVSITPTTGRVTIP